MSLSLHAAGTLPVWGAIKMAAFLLVTVTLHAMGFQDLCKLPGMLGGRRGLAAHKHLLIPLQIRIFLSGQCQCLKKR